MRGVRAGIYQGRRCGRALGLAAQHTLRALVLALVHALWRSSSYQYLSRPLLYGAPRYTSLQKRSSEGGDQPRTHPTHPTATPLRILSKVLRDRDCA